MTYKSNSAEGGVNNTDVTTGNSGGVSGDAFTNVTLNGGTVKTTTGAAYHGSFGYDFQQATAANQTYVQISDTPADTFAVSFMVNIISLPDVELQFPVSIRSSTDTSVCGLQLTPAGRIRVTASAGGGLSTVAQVITSGWYRIVYYGTGLNTASGTANVDVYTGDSATPLFQLAYTGMTTTALAGRVRYGKGSSAVLNSWQFDDIQQNIGSSSPIGILPLTYTLTDGVNVYDSGIDPSDQYTYDELISVTDELILTTVYTLTDSISVTDTRTQTIDAFPNISTLGSRNDAIMYELAAAGFTTGSIADREYARLKAATGDDGVGETLYDMYKQHGERPRLR